MYNHWWGKILGGIFGWMVFGPIGAVLGFWLGHFFDKGLFSSLNASEEAQQAFFNATFLVMGHIAKADGVVSQQDIQMAERVMTQLRLSPEKRQQAIRLFQQGKQADFNLEDTLRWFRKACPHHAGLMRTFLEIQLQAAYAKGHASSEAKRILQIIARLLGISGLNFAFYDAIFGFRNFHEQAGQQRADAGGYYYRPAPTFDLNRDYAILGITSKSTDAEVKKAYRRMMNQHHPDKLMSKGLPEEMIKMATEKTQRIKEAYERIMKARGVN